LSKKPSPRRNKKVQLINATEFYVPQKPKSLGNKRKFIDDENRKKIVDLYKAFEENEYSKIFDPEDFGYTKVTIDRPLYDEKGEKVIKKGAVQIDPSKRDTEYIPLKQDIDEYIKREVLLYVPDAIPDRSKDKIGYEIPFTRYFYKYTPPRPSKEIMAEIIEYEESISGVLKAVLEDA
jgi:type I restriction enzyme M protein